MKGDFSRRTFDRKKHYRGVLMQQGRVQVDADWNEQVHLEAYLRTTEAQDVIGLVGAPKYAGGFKVGRSPDKKDLTLSPGRIYVGGRLCENDPHPDGTTFFNQPWYPNPDKPESGRYLVYLDAWPRHVSAVEDPAIREVALGGADTASRMQTIWQVKLHKLEEEDKLADCEQFPPGWSPHGPSTAKLEARTAPAPQVTDPCLLPPGAGYLGLENQLYRVEIHTPGDVNEATFKWSRDNGSVLTAVKNISGQDIEVQDLGRSDHLGLAVDQWVELLGDKVEFHGDPGSLLHIVAINSAENIITVAGAIPPVADLGANLRIRRWDKRKEAPAGEEPQGIITDTWLPLENGLEVRFSGDTFRSGDYWLIPARTATRLEQGHIEWPLDELTAEPLAQPPLGIHHAYCPLALVEFDDGEFSPSQPADCRQIFPPLIEVAEEAKTGQLCCTFTVGNGKDSYGDYNDLQEALDDLPAAGGKICLLSGEHRGNFTIHEKQHLIISGCQWRTRVLPSAEQTAGPVFSIEDCTRVVLEYLDIINLEGTGIQAGTKPNLKLLDLDIRSNRILAREHAIRVNWGHNIVIQNNRIRMIDSKTSDVAIFLGGEQCRIEHNSIVVMPGKKEKKDIPVTDNRYIPNPSYECTELFNLYRHKEFYNYVGYAMEYQPSGPDWSPSEKYQTSGGIQIAGSSEDIRIVGNYITGGGWNGITLGHWPDGIQDPDQAYRKTAATHNMPYDNKSRLQSQFNGSLENIAILDNDIMGMGLNGIGVVSFFSLKEMGLIVSVNGLTIANNRIRKCLNQLSDFLDDDLWARMNKEMGFGGISLADCEHAVIRENTIADNGAGHLEPVCGIFMLHGEKVDISDNRILNNGPRPLNSAAAGVIRPGWRGGIVIALSFEELAREYLQEKELFYHDGIPAVKIHHNIVTQPVGKAIALVACGPVSIVGNHLTSLGIDTSSKMALLAGSVFIMNLGVSKDLIGAMFLLFGSMLKRYNALEADTAANIINALLHLPSGQVLYADNQTTLNLLTAGFEVSLSSQLIISLDDISYIGNQSECTSFLDVVFIDAGLVGATVRTCNNRFQSGFTGMLYSLVSFGFMNTTMGNQSTHCLIALGLPNFVQEVANTVFITSNCPDSQRKLTTHYVIE